MSVLKPGVLCIIIAGCPKNIGMIVEVIERLGAVDGYTDCFHIKTASGRPFAQLWTDARRADTYRKGPNPSHCYTERHKLRPLVDPKAKEQDSDNVDRNTEQSSTGRELEYVHILPK
jgi:hypothetical protein